MSILGLQVVMLVVFCLSHRLMVEDFHFRCMHVGITSPDCKNEVVETERGDVRSLQGTSHQRWHLEEDHKNKKWEHMVASIWKVALEVCGIKGVEMMLKIFGGGSRMYKWLLGRRKNGIYVCNMIGVWTT
jgi:hypothetical protein